MLGDAVLVAHDGLVLIVEVPVRCRDHLDEVLVHAVSVGDDFAVVIQGVSDARELPTEGQL
eukprot:10388900-Prorocentrum_lima.AAC.1